MISEQTKSIAGIFLLVIAVAGGYYLISKDEITKSSTNNNDQTTGISSARFLNSDGNYSFEPPAGWTVSLFSGSYSSSSSFGRPSVVLHGQSANLNESVCIKKVCNQASSTLQAFIFKLDKKDFNINSLAIFKKGTLTVAEREASYFTKTGIQTPVEPRSDIIVVPKNESLYIIEVQSTPKYATEAQKALGIISSSFKFVN